MAGRRKSKKIRFPMIANRQEVLVVEEGVSGSRRRPERDRLLDAARRREIDIIASETYRFRDQRARLE